MAQRLGRFDRHLDSNKKADIQRILGQLSRFAKDHKLAAVGVLHLRKAGGDRAMYRVMGSLGFVSAPRVVWGISEKEGDHKMVALKMNIARKPNGLGFSMENTANEAPRILWSPDPVTETADELLGDSRARVRTVSHDIAEWLTAMLATGPVETARLKELAEQEDYRWRTIETVRRRMPIQPRRDGENGQWRWHLVG